MSASGSLKRRRLSVKQRVHEIRGDELDHYKEISGLLKDKTLKPDVRKRLTKALPDEKKAARDYKAIENEA